MAARRRAATVKKNASTPKATAKPTTAPLERTVGTARPGSIPQEKAIDTILATLWADDASGYTMFDSATARGEAVKRIRERIASLDDKTRPAIADRTKYRLEQFEEFSTMPDRMREEVLRVARERHVSLEAAYAIVRGK